MSAAGQVAQAAAGAPPFFLQVAASEASTEVEGKDGGFSHSVLAASITATATATARTAAGGAALAAAGDIDTELEQELRQATQEEVFGLMLDLDSLDRDRERERKRGKGRDAGMLTAASLLPKPAAASGDTAALSSAGYTRSSEGSSSAGSTAASSFAGSATGTVTSSVSSGLSVAITMPGPAAAATAAPAPAAAAVAPSAHLLSPRSAAAVPEGYYVRLPSDESPASSPHPVPVPVLALGQGQGQTQREHFPATGAGSLLDDATRLDMSLGLGCTATAAATATATTPASSAASLAEHLARASTSAVDGTPLGPSPPPEQRPATVVFAERWVDKEARLARESPYSVLPGWRLLPVIVKSNDDLRQEQFVSQLLKQFHSCFRSEDVPVWMRPYDILATAADGGLIEAVPDTISVDSLKRSSPGFLSLASWFERHFRYGELGEERLRIAQLNFARSMAAYSIVCYLLNAKDRHNGNILLDRKGHVIHIDWGFLFTTSPGGNINFESAPFKLTEEYVEVMGGSSSKLFQTYKKLCLRAFLAVRRHKQRILPLIEMMLRSHPDLPCFRGGPRQVLQELRWRLHEHASERECVAIVEELVQRSLHNFYSNAYDRYQRWAQGIA